jgi:hypothetical protein
MTQPPLPIEYNGSFRDLYRDWEDSLRREATLQAELERVREALSKIKRLKSEPIGDSGFSTGPLALLNQAKLIAKDGLADTGGV